VPSRPAANSPHEDLHELSSPALPKKEVAYLPNSVAKVLQCMPEFKDYLDNYQMMVALDHIVGAERAALQCDDDPS
jgi:hypothetical protein